MPAADVTAEQLRLAWRQISRPGWPATLEAALELPAYRAALCGIARNLGRRGLDHMPAPPPAPAAPQLPLFPPPTTTGGRHAPTRTAPSRPDRRCRG